MKRELIALALELKKQLAQINDIYDLDTLRYKAMIENINRIFEIVDVEMGE